MFKISLLLVNIFYLIFFFIFLNNDNRIYIDVSQLQIILMTFKIDIHNYRKKNISKPLLLNKFFVIMNNLFFHQNERCSKLFMCLTYLTYP